ncbi:hypothetical protein [Roseibacillus ishigakijimensis]|uniref:Uncharacterized protein n=1 Tax=Roseibacillus ishigakijimensis TaxID=454146 RepID=A0A934RR12_9BACT|nr:hypothetical protein [Roseibacillus ishigakijimensis]MBK1835328.1 hypothetical protein [Roseibacillus ishigakijimensis]
MASPQDWPDAELASLVDGMIDGQLDQERYARLEERLRNEPAAADYCAQRILFNSKLAQILGPSRVELVQNRRLLIEGQGSNRRVVIGQSQTTQFGGGGEALLLEGTSPASNTRNPLWGYLSIGIAILLAALVLSFAILRQKESPPPGAPSPQEAGRPSSVLWHRKPKSPADLRYWLQNMSRHGFNLAEMRAATGLETTELESALRQYEITGEELDHRRDQLLVLPYPGGRHPRIGNREKAVNPQRDSKVSVFTPWSREDYVVLDLPEALSSDNYYYYLSHSDLPTIWSLQGVQLPSLEWERLPTGAYRYRRELPNGVSFGVEVTPLADSVRLRLTITNDTAMPIRNLKAQNCVLLGGMTSFSNQTLDNKVFQGSYAACHNEAKDRWVITGWESANRLWGIASAPCLHADPLIPVCQPGETVVLNGWFSFYEGEDITAELARIEALGWKDAP